MKMMKKILVCALALMLVMALTACAGKCAHCGQRIKGDGFERDGKKYCDENCSDRASFEDMLEGFVPEENKDNVNEDKDDVGMEDEEEIEEK